MKGMESGGALAPLRLSVFAVEMFKSFFWEFIWDLAFPKINICLEKDFFDFHLSGLEDVVFYFLTIPDFFGKLIATSLKSALK